MGDFLGKVSPYTCTIRALVTQTEAVMEGRRNLSC